MVMKNVRPDFLIKDFISNLHKDKFGYDIQEVAEKLIENTFKIEYGFYDKDILGHNFQNKPLLKNLQKTLDSKKIPPKMVKYLKETINFVKKYPDDIKIKKLNSNDLKNYIKESLPVIVHLNAKSLGADSEEIHAVIINGYDGTGFYIVNPPKIAEEHVDFESFQKFWGEAGHYYLVIKKG